MTFPASLFDAWRTYSRQRQERRIHRQTINAVSDLPTHILKDIGWPGAYERQRKYHQW
ncbi:MAG: hypothetical protein BroJett030_08500 [Alphaproteobacteria bacterium]|nr:MAG: hypothetical protein BroJett030_08500 [Alphaproteobacteria bacterium]